MPPILELLNDPMTYMHIIKLMLDPVWPYPRWIWALPPAFVVLLTMASSRLAKFNRADWPILSSVIRDWLAAPTYVLGVILLIALASYAGAIAALSIIADAVPGVWEQIRFRAYFSALGLSGGFLLGRVITDLVIPRWERLSGAPDVLDGSPVNDRDYDPTKLFKLKRGIFFGLDANGRASYLPLPVARQHMQIVGSTGSGKGVAAQVLIPQFLLAGETCFVFDPKDDKHLPEVTAAFCAERGIKFRLIDLRPSAPPQLNLLRGIDGKDFATLLNAGFDLADTGGIDRVYRLDDRHAATNTGALIRDMQGASLPELAARAALDTTITEARVFFGFLQELAALPVFATREGIDLGACLQEPGLTYVIGSTLDPVVIMAQKMLLLRVLQLIYSRPREQVQRWVTVFMDEFKYLLSIPSINALGVVRDYQCHLMIAHQSLGDLEACPGIPAATVAGAVRDNANLKLVYQPIDDGTAQWAENLSGTTLKHIESTAKRRRDGGAPDGSWQTQEVPLIHRNHLYTLPKMTGVLYGDGVARYTAMRPLRAHAQRPKAEGAPPIAGGGATAQSMI